MRRMWTRHDLLRYAGAEVTGKDTIRRMWSEDELIKINFLNNYNEALWEEYKNQLNFSTMRKMYSEEMLTYHLNKKLIDLPPNRYVQTTSADFDASGDYTGTASYIILPANKPSGYVIRNLNVKGVATNGDYLTSTKNMFNGNNNLYLELNYLNTSNVISIENMFFDSQATKLDLSSFDTSKVTNMYRTFYFSRATKLDLSSFNTSKVTNMNQMFEGSRATTGYARTQADADNFNNSSNKPARLVFEVK